MNDTIETFAARLRSQAEVPPPASLWLRTEAAYLAAHPARRRIVRRAWLAVAASALLAGPLYVALTPTQRAPDPQVLQIEAIDRELQRAYSSGASDADLDALWRERERQVQQMQDRNPPQPLRI